MKPLRCVVAATLPKDGPNERFVASLASDPALVFGGVLRDIPGERNLGAAEWVPSLGCWRRQFYCGWFEYYPATEMQRARVYFRPFPGRHLPAACLRRVIREFPEEVTPELRAMLSFAEYDQGTVF